MRSRAHRDQPEGSVSAARAAFAPSTALSSPLVLLLGLLAVSAGVPAASAAAPQLHVNYAHDWISGTTNPEATVVVVIEDESHALKAATTVLADGGGFFLADCGAYPPELCPNLVPGDTIIVSAAGEEARVEPVGWIEGLPDEEGNTISGTLHADWLTGPVDVRCEIWMDPGAPPVDTAADPDGGTFTCDFTGSWDLEWGHVVAVSYFEPDGDQVTNIVVWPWMRVNYAHDWIGGNYPGGHGVTVTVFEAGADACEGAGGNVKAVAELTTGWGEGWGEDGFDTAPWHWSPEPPDILPGDVVEFVIPDHAGCEAVDVGEIAADVNVAEDDVSGTVDAPWLTGPVQVECHPWGAPVPAPIKTDLVEPDGVATFTCDWSGEWDILPGQDVAVMYFEPDTHHMVINVVHEPAPHLSINKWAHGAPAEGGNFVFTIHYENIGDAPAENVTLTDTMDIVIDGTPVPGGMVYLSDSSGLPQTGAGSGPILWDVGTLDPDQGGEFEVYVEVTSSAGEDIRNTVEIGTSSFDTGPPEEKSAWWEGPVLENDTHLDVAKNSWIPDPTAGEPIVFNIPVCNRGQTGSTELTLTDTMGAGLTLDTWWPDHPGWSETSSGPGGFTLTTPSIPGNECREVRVQAIVDLGVTPGQPLSNLAVISADNDMETGDNESLWEGIADAPHLNLWIIKRLNRGVLVPGGELTYNIPYGNNGNQAAAPVLIVDTLPLGSSFVSSWHSGTLGHFDIIPTIIEPEYVVWQLAEMPGGASGNIEVHLAIDPAATPGTELTNTVEICGPPSEPPEPCDPIPGEDTYDDNTSEWTEVLFPVGPNLRITKRSAWLDESTLRYILRLQNIGNQTIPDVAVSDALPAVTFWDGWWDTSFPPERLDGDIVHDGGVLTWNFHELHAGENGRVRFTAVLDGTQEPLQWIDNYAEITIPGGDTNPEDNADTTTDLWGNQCGGDDVSLFEETYTDVFWCHAAGSITANTVTVTGTGQVILRSPLIVLENAFAVESGGTLEVGAP